MATCSINGCERPSSSRGWCRAHYERWRVHGDPMVSNRKLPQLCSIEGCGRTRRARGWCKLHWRRWVEHADPLWQRPTTLDRFNAKWKLRDDGCWQWTGARNGAGYGSFWVTAAGRKEMAHRTAYELHRGPIPIGLEIDHLCFNRLCVNPDHMEAVTPAENARRGSNKRWSVTRHKRS